MDKLPVTLVTGTSTGIGFATALHLARHGHRVVATMRNLAKAGPLEEAARQERLPLTVRELDVTRPDSIDRAVVATRDGEGPIDVLVNNAGIGGATPLELTPEAEHRAMFEANYWGPIRMIQAVLPSMRHVDRGARGHPEPDRVLRLQARAGRRERGAGPRGGRLRGPRGDHRARRDPDRDLRELGARHPLRQDLAVPADHAPQR
jgi:NAD(P)-dependent dehydrogenase (short-subunit alcohol dehydrogenase family)